LTCPAFGHTLGANPNGKGKPGVEQRRGTGLQRTEEAMQRLGAAIERLEGAAARVGAGDLLLAGELRESREDYERLDETVRIVAGRLDDTIDRLRGLLEE